MSVGRAVVRSEDLRWKPPNFGLYKINFDSAVFADQVSASIRVVLKIGRVRSSLP